MIYVHGSRDDSDARGVKLLLEDGTTCKCITANYRHNQNSPAFMDADDLKWGKKINLLKEIVIGTAYLFNFGLYLEFQLIFCNPHNPAQAKHHEWNIQVF